MKDRDSRVCRVLDLVAQLARGPAYIDQVQLLDSFRRVPKMEVSRYEKRERRVAVRKKRK